MNNFTVILIFILTTCAGAAFTVSYTRRKFPAGCIRNGVVISGGRNGAGVMRFACAAAAGGAAAGFAGGARKRLALVVAERQHERRHREVLHRLQAMRG